MITHKEQKFTFRAKNAWAGNDIKSKLESGVVEFSFFELKEGGATTVRQGTRDPQILNKLTAFIPPQGVKDVPPEQVVFWDLELDEWRSFRKSEFGSILDYVDSTTYINDYLE